VWKAGEAGPNPPVDVRDVDRDVWTYRPATGLWRIKANVANDPSDYRMDGTPLGATFAEVVEDYGPVTEVPAVVEPVLAPCGRCGEPMPAGDSGGMHKSCSPRKATWTKRDKPAVQR
jgi:hypothetical protein